MLKKFQKCLIRILNYMRLRKILHNPYGIYSFTYTFNFEYFLKKKIGTSIYNQTLSANKTTCFEYLVKKMSPLSKQ